MRNRFAKKERHGMVLNSGIPVHTEKRGLGVSLKTVRLIQGAVEAALD